MTDFRRSLELLASAWSAPFPTEQVAVYAEMLADVPDAELLSAVRGLILSDDRRPSIARIRRAVVESRGELPTPDAAVEQADRLDLWREEVDVPTGAGVEPEKPLVHPAVEEAWRAVGSADSWSFPTAYRTAAARWTESRLAGRLDRPALTVGDPDA